MVEVAALILISEIMYNPNSSESPPNDVEWVEIYNPGNETMDISGWYLADEEGQTAPLPEGTLLQASQAVVLIPAEQSVEDFHAAWGKNISVITLDHWDKSGMGGLANSPTSDNEILELYTAEGKMVDQVNFDDQDDWPGDKPDGPSIYLKPDALDVKLNDLGSNWAQSQINLHGAHENNKTEDFDGADIGSPGVVKIK